MENDSPTPHEKDALYEGFVRLFVTHERRLRAFLRAMALTWDEVDEVMQETSLVAWRKFGRFEQGSNFLAWCASIARFEALRHLRERTRQRALFSDTVVELLQDELVDHAEILVREREALERCLQKLSSSQRELLELAYQPGVKLHEAAAKAGKTVQGCYKTVQRLRAKLYECVRAELTEESP